jgi:putative membrane protein
MLSMKLALGALLAAVPLAGFAQSVTDKETFAEMAASSNMFEIQSSELALQESQDEDVRAFAQKMIEDHTAAGEKMKAAAATDGVTPPEAMVPEHQSQLDTLESNDGEAFDQAYVDAQAVAHDEAVTLFEQFSTEGEESALRDFAAETLPTLKEHQTEIHEMTGD